MKFNKLKLIATSFGAISLTSLVIANVSSCGVSTPVVKPPKGDLTQKSALVFFSADNLTPAIQAAADTTATFKAITNHYTIVRIYPVQEAMISVNYDQTIASATISAIVATIITKDTKTITNSYFFNTKVAYNEISKSYHENNFYSWQVNNYDHLFTFANPLLFPEMRVAVKNRWPNSQVSLYSGFVKQLDNQQIIIDAQHKVVTLHNAQVNLVINQKIIVAQLTLKYTATKTVFLFSDIEIAGHFQIKHLFNNPIIKQALATALADQESKTAFDIKILTPDPDNAVIFMKQHIIRNGIIGSFIEGSGVAPTVFQTLVEYNWSTYQYRITNLTLWDPQVTNFYSKSNLTIFVWKSLTRNSYDPTTDIIADVEFKIDWKSIALNIKDHTANANIEGSFSMPDYLTQNQLTKTSYYSFSANIKYSEAGNFYAIRNLKVDFHPIIN